MKEERDNVAFGADFGGKVAHKLYGILVLSPLLTGTLVFYWTGNGKYAILSWALNMVALLLLVTCPAWEKKHDA